MLTSGIHILEFSEKIGELAKAEYDAGGSDKAIAKINSMNSDELKEHLISLVKEEYDIRYRDY